MSTEALQNEHIELSLVHQYEPAIHQWALWTPPSSDYDLNHHLFLEDELFNYSVERNWPLPGHFCGEKVIFAVQLLADSRFVPEFDVFWERWVS